MDFDLDVVTVRGTLRQGEEPLAATLYVNEMGVPRFRWVSDEKGRFEGHLFKEGLWRIDVESREPLVSRSLPRVAVRRAPGRSVVELALDLPNGRVQGRVTGEHDEPIARALVTVTTAGAAPVTLRSEGSGEFSRDPV